MSARARDSSGCGRRPPCSPDPTSRPSPRRSDRAGGSSRPDTARGGCGGFAPAGRRPLGKWRSDRSRPAKAPAAHNRSAGADLQGYRATQNTDQRPLTQTPLSCSPRQNEGFVRSFYYYSDPPASCKGFRGGIPYSCQIAMASPGRQPGDGSAQRASARADARGSPEDWTRRVAESPRFGGWRARAGAAILAVARGTFAGMESSSMHSIGGGVAASDAGGGKHVSSVSAWGKRDAMEISVVPK